MLESTYHSPFGFLRAISDGDCLLRLFYTKCDNNVPAPKFLSQALDEYFSGGTLQNIDIITNGSPFAQKVWLSAKEIPHGQTTTYGELAAQIGHKGAARAVGTALGANPISLFIPCHRVVSKEGIGGFAWGIEIKHQLLMLESKIA